MNAVIGDTTINGEAREAFDSVATEDGIATLALVIAAEKETAGSRSSPTRSHGDSELAVRNVAAAHAQELGEYAKPIDYDGVAMLEELNKVQREAHSLMVRGKPLTAIVNTVPRDGVFQSELKDLYRQRSPKTDKTKKERLAREMAKHVKQVEKVPGWTIAGPDTTMGQQLEDIELDAAGRAYQRKPEWMPYECQQCLDPGMPPSKKRGIYRSQHAFLKHKKKQHNIDHCQPCNEDFTGVGLKNHR